MDIILDPNQEIKPPGLQLTGTQASVTFHTSLVPPSDALAGCEQILNILCTLSPPVKLIFKVNDLILPPESTQASHEPLLISLQAAEPPLSFSRQLEPQPTSLLASPSTLLKAGLTAEFPATAPMVPVSQSNDSTATPITDAARILNFIGIGEASIPRGCKWSACAGIVLQLPDHVHNNQLSVASGEPAIVVETGESVAIGQSDAQSQSQAEHQQEDASNQPSTPPEQTTPAFVFKSYALQMLDRTTASSAFQKVDWSGNGFKLLNIKATGENPGPLEVLLSCDQPESEAVLAAFVVHVYLQPEFGPGSEAHSRSGPLKLAQKHEGLLIRGAVDAALKDLSRLCPAVVSGRRARSLSRALPVVSKAVGAILMRSVGSGVKSGVLSEACAALGAQPTELVQVLNQKLEEAVMVVQEGEEGGVEPTAGQ